MQQWGLKLNSSEQIDNLAYTYDTNSNKLLKVTDATTATTGLGDFTDGNTTGNDYTYNNSGSLTADKNKGHTIAYNQFNLPYKITIPGKGDITYIYSATGAKLEKRTHILHDSTRGNVEITATTTYLAGYIYQDNKLSFFGHEVGRIRVNDSTLNPQLSTAFVYDYFLKDHLGNIRTVLTEEQKTDAYPPATMELGNEQRDTTLYSNILSTRSDKPAGYPVDTAYTNPNDKVAKLDGVNKKIGPGITLKVMAGDKFNIRVSSWYRQETTTPANPANPLTDLLTALVNGVGGSATTAHGSVTATALNNSGVLPPGATQFLNNQTYNSGKPKAYLNWILFDEHFKYDSANSGFEQVGDDTIFTIHTKSDLAVGKNGYLYVYVSNVTGNIPVYFDNLQVSHVRGPLLEENHYYPFGLQMKGICSKAAGGVENKYKFNGGVELDGDFGLDIYETFFRGYDAQIGRFRSEDPKAEMTFELSTFQFSGNNPVVYNDPLGDQFGYMDHNGNKWHGPSPLQGTGFGYFEYNEMNQTITSDGWGGGSIGESVFSIKGMMGRFGVKNGQPGYSVPYSYSINNGDKDISNGFTSTGRNLDGLGIGKTFIRLENIKMENIRFDKQLESTGQANDLVDAAGKVSMVSTGKAIAKVTGPVGFAIGFAQVRQGYLKDGNKFGNNAQKASSGFVGGIAGAWAGFEAGVFLGFEGGFAVGAAFGGIGAIPGGILGGFIGAFGGAYYGSQFGESLIHK